MNGADPVTTLYDTVKRMMGSDLELSAVKDQLDVLEQNGFPAEVVEQVYLKFQDELDSQEQMPEGYAPRLLVDWCELPRVGHQVRPEFSLICPFFNSKPELLIGVDEDLDHDPDHAMRRPQAEEIGLWTFTVPFKMTTESMDCRPGRYLIDVAISFRDVPSGCPRFFRCKIRLNVPDLAAEDGGVLEIDGDGQSMINLQGHDLKQFSKVVLKGGEDSVINLANAFGSANDDGSADQQQPKTTFEYELKIDSEKQGRLPVLCQQNQERSRLKKGAFFFEDGRRVLIFTQKRLEMGRSRNNDIVLRFLPKSEQNNADSRSISRTHFLLELTSEGIDITDKSGSGIEVNQSVVESVEKIRDFYADTTDIELGVTGSVNRSFDLEMVTFTPGRDDHPEQLEFWEEIYCELVGGRMSGLSRQSLAVGLNAIRFDRKDDLADRESYLLLTREVLIGSSNECGIVLAKHVPRPLAALRYINSSFWLEPLPGIENVQVEEAVVKPKTMVPLTPGMRVQFGDEVATFDHPRQTHLDD